MPSGEIERQPHVVVGGREITDMERDRTRMVEHRVQTRQHVILRANIVYETLGEPRCLITASLQPENTPVVAIEYHSLVGSIEADV